MTTDELRAKFELHCEKYARNLSLRRHPERDYWYEETRQAWELWQSAHASRDAEGEALERECEEQSRLIERQAAEIARLRQRIESAPLYHIPTDRPTSEIGWLNVINSVKSIDALRGKRVRLVVEDGE